MKALVLEAVGQLVYKEVCMPEPKAGEVLLKVMACGICSSDFDRCLKTGTYHFPTIPGHEFSGQIAAVGEGVDASLIGKRAVVLPLLPDHTCDQCQIEAYARCRNYDYHGSRCDGAFAEYLATPVWNIQTFDDSLDYKVAALCEPAAVAYHGVSAANLKPGLKTLVVGTGAIGIMVGLWAREQGAKVVFACRNERKRAFIESFGFTEFYDGKTNDFDVALECVGSNESLEMVINAVKPAATIVLVGNPDGDKSITRKVYWKILRSELTLKGVWNSSYTASNNEWQKVLRAFEKDSSLFAKLITHTFPLSDGLDAFATLKNPQTFAVKGMFVND